MPKGPGRGGPIAPQPELEVSVVTTFHLAVSPNPMPVRYRRESFQGHSSGPPLGANDPDAKRGTGFWLSDCTAGAASLRDGLSRLKLGGKGSELFGRQFAARGN